MRGLRRILVPVSWALLLAWMAGPLLPEAGVRVHAHADGDAAHVHLDELIAEAIGHRGHHHHPAGAGHAPSAGAVRREPQRHVPADSLQADDAASRAHAHASSPFLLFLLAVLGVLLLATRAAALAPFPGVALREARRGRPRARAPPLHLPGRRFQTT